MPRIVASAADAVRTVPQVLRSLRRPAQFVGFWAAVVLPVCYLPLLFGGLRGAQTRLFSALLVGNAMALVAGHGYGQTPSEE
jgi:hypothetical protein